MSTASVDPASFGSKTTALEVCQAYSQQIKGKRVILTGPTTTGIGYATAEAIVRFGPEELVLAGRNLARVGEARDKLLSVVPTAHITVLQIDLSSMSSVRRGAEEILKKGQPVDVLINNAGIMDTPFTLTEEGFEIQLATNHLGSWLLTMSIIALILKSDLKRVVNVSSHGHSYGPVRWDDPNFSRGDYTPNLGYGQSKAAMVLSARDLAQRFGPKGLTVYSLHPGGIATPLQKHWTKEMKVEMGRAYGAYDEHGNILENADIWKSPEAGAATTCCAAFSPALNPNGGYLDDCQMAEHKCTEYVKDSGNVVRIFEWTNQLVGGGFA